MQEAVLGIGGWRLLESLGIPIDICHLNEGHAALAVLERALSFKTCNGVSFHEALIATRAGNILPPIRWSTRALTVTVPPYCCVTRIVLSGCLPIRNVRYSWWWRAKAHPEDECGKQLVQAWAAFVQRPEIRQRAVFLQDYDISLAQELVQGVDLWINTPRRLWEACGTSGMKILVNGALNLSFLDGWWAEAYSAEVGWAIGDHQKRDVESDAMDAEQLYRFLEEEIVPAFYGRNEEGIPVAWVSRIRASMAHLAPQ